MSFQFGSYAASDPGSAEDFLRIDDQGLGSADRFQLNVIGPTGDDVNGFTLAALTLDLTHPTGTAFDDDSIPGSLDLAHFSNASAALQFQNGSTLNVLASVDSIEIVPEPGTAVLVLGGLLGLAARRRPGS